MPKVPWWNHDWWNLKTSEKGLRINLKNTCYLNNFLCMYINPQEVWLVNWCGWIYDFRPFLPTGFISDSPLLWKATFYAPLIVMLSLALWLYTPYCCFIRKIYSIYNVGFETVDNKKIHFWTWKLFMFGLFSSMS